MGIGTWERSLEIVARNAIRRHVAGIVGVDHQQDAG